MNISGANRQHDEAKENRDSKSDRWLCPDWLRRTHYGVEHESKETEWCGINAGDTEKYVQRRCQDDDGGSRGEYDKQEHLQNVDDVDKRERIILAG